jgi:hypothetical protein
MISDSCSSKITDNDLWREIDGVQEVKVNLMSLQEILEDLLQHLGYRNLQYLYFEYRGVDCGPAPAAAGPVAADGAVGPAPAAVAPVAADGARLRRRRRRDPLASGRYTKACRCCTRRRRRGPGAPPPPTEPTSEAADDAAAGARLRATARHAGHVMQGPDPAAAVTVPSPPESDLATYR